MGVLLTNEMREAMRSGVRARHVNALIKTFREKNSSQVSHLSNQQLGEAIEAARKQAVEAGLKSKKLRMRLLMFAVLRMPEFWKQEPLNALMQNSTGTPDENFADVCATLKVAARRAGRPDFVWWD